MRKVFRGALVLAISSAMLGGFSACKDTQDDLLYQTQLEFTKKLQDQNTSLEELRQSQNQALANAIAQLQAEIEAAKCNCNPQDLVDINNKIAALQNQLATDEANHATDIADLAQQIVNVNSAVSDLQIALAELEGKYVTNEDFNTHVDAFNELNRQFTELQAGLDQKIQDAINAALENYVTAAQLADTASTLRAETATALDELKTLLQAETQAVSDRLNVVSGKVDNLEGTVGNLQDQVDNLEGTVGNLQDQVDNLEGTVGNLQDQVDNLEGTVGDLQDQVTALTGTVADLIDAYQAADQLLQDQIDALTERVEANEKAIEAVQKQLAKLVTSVIIQGTYNPSVGSLSLPANIQSNILCAYYGETENDIEFPSVLTGNLVDQTQGLTAKDIKLLNETGLESTLKILNGTKIVGDEGNAGKVYLTVNPTAVDFEGLSFDLVNSLDEKSGITLSSLTPSTDKLTFGYTRGESANGFYEAKATLTEENINKAKLNINKTALKNAVKDLYKNKTAAKLTTVIGTIYAQLNDELDRNAVKASWTVDGQSNSVYSQYGIAAFAYSPLSFAFDPSLSLSLPNIPNIPTFDNTDFTFNISAPDFKIDLSTVKINLGITVDEATIDAEKKTIVVGYQVPEFEYNPALDASVVKTDENHNVVYTTEYATVDLEDLIDDLTKQIADKFNTALGGLDAKIQEQIIDQLGEQIESQVATSLNNTIADLNNSINSQIKDKIGSTLSSYQNYLDKLQTWIDRFNSLINRVSTPNINHYLQATLVYQTDEYTFSQVSTSPNNPSIFKVASGNALTLHPTSYSAELIAPAYKKFIGVTNVYNNDDPSLTAQKGNSACLAAARVANGQKYVNEVISGERYGVPFVGEAGFTYEIVYAALDYQGKVSMRKYYVKVI